jgi:hypothetical protein
VSQLPSQNVTDDLHISVAMGTETFTWFNAIFIDHAQITPVHVMGIVIVGKGEAMKGLQPTVIGKSSVR